MSNLSAIGFIASTEEEFESTIFQALERATEPTELGAWAKRHAWFIDPSGAAIAAHLDGEQIGCVTPFFVPADGGTRWWVHTEAPHIDGSCADCSGADCDILDDAAGEMVTRSAVQWLYFDAYRDWLSDSRRFELQVAGFASTLSLCSTDDEWEAAQAAMFGGTHKPGEVIENGDPIRLADEAFLSHGMFENDGQLGSRARALVTGRVESLAHPTNELTGERFTWARIRSMCGLLDIVASFETATRPTPGMRALADVWLVGRPIDPPPPPKKRGWLKLVGR